MFSICLLVTIVSLFLLYCKFVKPPSYLDKIPRVTPWYPVLGNGLLLGGKSSEKFFTIMNSLFAQHDRLFQLWFGPKLVIGVSHPDLVEKVLTSAACLEKPYFYRFSRVDQGLWAAKKTLWQSQRKAVNAAFSTRVLNDFIPTINDCCNTLVHQLRATEEHEVNLLQYTIPCALRMICGTTMGNNVSDSGAAMEEFLNSFNRLAEIVGDRFNTLHLQPEIIYRLTTHYREELKHRETCFNFTKKILDEKKCQMEDSSSKSKIFIEHLLDKNLVKRSFSDIEIVQNVYNMIAAGSETTAYTIANACLLLALHQDIQGKIYQEISEYFPDQNPDITPQSLASLRQTESFLKEVLRLYPIAPMIARESSEPFELDGIRFPKGTTFLLNFYVLHRRQDLWGHDSTRFDPDRFSVEPQTKDQRHSFAYLPFSGGPRNCIGYRYAMMTLKIMLVHLVKNFKMTTNLTAKDVRFKFALLLTLISEHSIVFERRN